MTDAPAPRIEVRDLTVVFGEDERRVVAVDAVSFRVEPGASFGLVGESGSGKSTVLRAICGLAPVAGGQILIDGREVSFGSPMQARAAGIETVFLPGDPTLEHVSSSLVKEVSRFGGDVSGLVPDEVRDALVALRPPS